MAGTSTTAVRLLNQPVVLVAALWLAACGKSTDNAHTSTDETPQAAEHSECPSTQLREARAPDVRPEHEDPNFWLADTPDADLDLLDADERSYLAARVAELPGGWRDPLGEAGGDPELIERELDERLEWLRGRVSAGKYVETAPGALERAAARVESAAPIEGPALRFVVDETSLWCVPTTEGLFSDPVDLDFDRNRCASLHPGELVRTLRRTPDGAWTYVDAGHSVGWVDQSTAPTLGPALDPAAAGERLGIDDTTPRLWLTEDIEELRAGSNFPLLGEDDERRTILVPGLAGPHERELPGTAPASAAALTFTRRAVFEQAFALLEQPYGWGGREGRRDCSRYLHDLFAQFGLRLPRNSAVQAQLGTRSVDLSELDEPAKREAIRAAAREGVVLLYMPGHIMLYLGHDGDHDYGISSLSEYLVPCPGGPDTVHRLDKVAVTTLELGRGSERRAFIERITRMAVFGPTPDSQP
ncbi:NlpC/P60 family protein [Enhygromyxa salina]|nr:NlpC/P60 family protein [Enhygromyxa salina]